MTHPLLIRNLDDLMQVLFDVLGFRRTLKENERILGVMPDVNGLIGTICTFLIVMQEAKTPAINDDLVAGVLAILKFLPIEESFGRSLEIACDELSDLCVTQAPRIRKRENPVAYFVMRASDLPGFSLLALASIDLIRSNRRSGRLVPALAASCATVPDAVSHFNLTPEDIIGAGRYLKRNGERLSRESMENYIGIQKSLLEAVKEIFSCLGYGNPTLLLEPEELEIAKEEACKKKGAFTIRQFPHIAEQSILKPKIILSLLQYIVYDRNPIIRDYRDFNARSIMTIPNIIFIYGSKVEDLLRIRISNFERDMKRIRIDIPNPDPLLQETTVYIPLHEETFEAVDSLIRYRTNKNTLSPDEPLFALQTGKSFYPIEISEIERLFKRLSARYGKNITENTLYLSHLAYFVGIGDINPIVSDRISNRVESIVYIDRIYCASYLSDIRSKHHSAFRRVLERLGLTITSSAMSVSDEYGIVLGGKRAPGKQVIQAIFNSTTGKPLV